MKSLKTITRLKGKYHPLINEAEIRAMQIEYMNSDDCKTLNICPQYHIGNEAYPVIITCGNSNELKYLVRLSDDNKIMKPKRVTVKLLSIYAKEWWDNKAFYQVMGIDAIQLLHYCIQKNKLSIAGIHDFNHIHYIDISRLPDKERPIDEIVAMRSRYGHDNLTKYECISCGGQFILGDYATKCISKNEPKCPYCGSDGMEWRAKVMHDEIPEMGDMSINSILEK